MPGDEPTHSEGQVRSSSCCGLAWRSTAVLGSAELVVAKLGGARRSRAGRGSADRQSARRRYAEHFVCDRRPPNSHRSGRPARSDERGRNPAAIHVLRYVGSVAASVTWSRRCPRPASSLSSAWWRTCCESCTTVVRPIAKLEGAAAIRIGMPNSPTSMVTVAAASPTNFARVLR